MQQLRSAIHNAIARFLKNQPPARIIAVGFALLILLGAALLMLPFAVHPGAHVGPLDALFTATSAVCVTGLVVVDTGDTFSLFGQAVIAILIQIGGLGVASIGMGLALVAGRRISLKGRSLVREALNVESLEGMVRLVRAILLVTLICEVAGAALSFPSFARDHMPLQAVWLSIFHSIAAFNNAGFDALGGGQSLIPYQNDLLLNLVTDALVIVGGIGFMVILDVGRCRGQFRRITFHTKVVLSTTAVLLVGGAVLLQLTDHMGWLAALFQSMTARTAGFSSVDLGSMSNAGLLVIMILMFIGASPGSTGGGIKMVRLLIILGIIYISTGGHNHMDMSQGFFPDLSKFDNLVLASSIFLFYAGMEMMGIHVMDVKNPSRNYPKAIVIGSLVTVLIFVLGTFSLGFIIPAKDINLTQSLLIGFDNYFHYLRISWASPIIAVALMFGVLAGVLTWVSGPSKGIFAVGRAGYLPPFFQKSNKNGVQRNILLIQGGVVTLLALLFVVMPSVQSFYQILSQLTVLLYLIMYMLMFSAAIVLRYKMKGTARPFRLGKKGNGLMWTIGTVGFCGALLAFILSFVPPSQISVGSNTVWFSVLIIGCVVVVGAPFVIYAMRKPSWKDPQAAAEFAPFHWEVKAAPETQNIPQNNPQNTGNTAPENKQ